MNSPEAGMAMPMNCATSVRGLDLRPAPGWMTIEPDEDFVASNGPDEMQMRGWILTLPEETQRELADDIDGHKLEDMQRQATMTWKRARVLSLGAQLPDNPHISWNEGDYVYFPEWASTPLGCEHVLMLQTTPIAWSPGSPITSR